MSDHLRFSGKGEAAQRAALQDIVRSDAMLMKVLETLREIDLADWLVASGAIYNNVWNALTGRPRLTGINDVDVLYYDSSDLSYEAEDAIIKRLDAQFAALPVPVQVRNQARVHLWFPQKFGAPFSPLTSSHEALERYASRAHAVAIKLEADDSLTIHAPFGLDEMFSFRLLPNRVLDNSKTHAKKGARAKAIWPELYVEPW